MDLRECMGGSDRRHPWELSRLEAVRSLLAPILSDRRSGRVLDIGCGDAFVCRELRKNAPYLSITAVDRYLTDEKISNLSSLDEGIRFCNDYTGLEGEKFDLVLLLDVLEHIEDELRFLREIVDAHTASGGYLLVTVPAFQWLFGSHDRYLDHLRRYGRGQLLGILRDSGFPCLQSGYLFLSLLPIRLLSRVREMLRIPSGKPEQGVGGWSHGDATTDLVKSILILDNRLSMALNRIGVRIPGLSVWAICRKPR